MNKDTMKVNQSHYSEFPNGINVCGDGINIDGHALIKSGTADPVTTPDFIGQKYVQTTDDKIFIATGVIDSNDWTDSAGAGGTGSGVRTANVVIAASNSPNKDEADYVCPGTDDQVTIQTAVGNAGDVYFMDGNYSKSNAAGIGIPSNTKLTLAKGATIKLVDGVDADSFIFVNSDQTDGNVNIEVRGGTLDCNYEGQTSGDHRGIHFENVFNAIIDTSVENHNHYEFCFVDCPSIEFVNRAIPTEEYVIADCQTLDNWHHSESGSLVIDSSVQIQGSNSLNFTTSTTGNGYTKYGNQTPHDLCGIPDFKKYHLGIWLYIPDIGTLSTIRLRYWSNTGGYYTDIYSIATNEMQSGKWYKLIIDPASGNSGIPFDQLDKVNEVLIHLQGSITTVNIGGLVAVPISKEPVITAVVDDGATVARDSLPLFQKYGYRGAVGVVPSWVGTSGHLTIEELREMSDAGWDMVAHTLRHPHLPDVDPEVQYWELIGTKKWIEQQGFRGADFFVPPYHDVDPDVEDMIEKIFLNHRYYQRGVPHDTDFFLYSIWGARPHMCGGVESQTFSASTSFKERLARHGWWMPYSHGSTGYYDALFAYCKANGIPVKTFSELYGLTDAPKPISAPAIRVDSFTNLLAASTNHVHAGFPGTGAYQQITTGITNPDVSRNVSVTVTNVASPSGNAILYGVDGKNNIISEIVTIVAGGTAYSHKGFATVNMIAVGGGISAADTVTVGISNKLGLSGQIIVDQDIFKCKKNNADIEILATNEYNAIVNAITIAAGDDFTIWYRVID